MNEIFNLEYNTERPKLFIPEYGRHFQKMVDHAVAIEDRDERNRVAKSIISVMGNLQPHLRDVPDFQHKLWDQLFIMADFKLDVDSPFPITSQEVLQVPFLRKQYQKNDRCGRKLGKRRHAFRFGIRDRQPHEKVLLGLEQGYGGR